MAENLKRFYETVSVRPEEGGFDLLLDDRLLRSPARNPLLLPSRALADAVAEEWARQEGPIDPGQMPLMTLVSTAIDHLAPNRAQIASETVDYGGHDLICYWAGEDQPELLRRQRDAWQPMLDWASRELGVPLHIVQGVVPQAQPTETLERFAREVGEFDDLHLMALTSVTRASGSLVLALALARGRLSSDEVWELSLLDENYQAELWGEDAEATARRAGLKADIEAAARLLALLDQP